MGVSRRSFLKSSAASAAVTMAGGPVMNVLGKSEATMTPGAGNTLPGKVVINFNKDAVVLTSSSAAADPAVVKTMIQDSIQFLTDKTTAVEAWRSLFPATLTSPPKIAIKVPVGFASKRMIVPWQSIKAIIDDLIQMDFGGAKLPAENITIYEAKSQMLSSEKFSSNGYTAANLPGVKIVFDSNSTGATDGAKNLQYAKSLQSSNYLINVFRAGGHMAMFENLTLGFKNHFGTYAVDHTNNAPAYIRDINCTGAVFNKTVLSICVGLFGAAEGPGQPGDPDVDYSNYVKTVDSTATRVEPRTIIMSTDPVTAEMQTIKMMRLNSGKKFAVADMPNFLKASGGVDGSLSDKVYNIGIIDEAKMTVLKIVNGQRIGTGVGNKRTPDTVGRADLHVEALKGQRATFIEFSVPHSSIGAEAAIEVFDIKGSLVVSFKRPINGILNNFSWDEKNSAGQHVPNGSYIVTLITGATKHSGKVLLFR